VKLVFNDFHYESNVIPKSAVVVDEDEFTVKANSEHKSTVKLKLPANIVSGQYTSTLRVIVEK
jgi:hypothetical protein